MGTHLPIARGMRLEGDSRDADLLRSTLKPAGARSSVARWTVPSLTVLFHPDVRRIGDCARLLGLLDRKEVVVGRLEPAFAAPGASGGAPLAHRSVSRRRLRLVPSGRGLRLEREAEVEVRVDGAPLTAPRELSADQLERGVVLELGDRVALLLHRLGPPAPALPRLGLVGDSEELERVRAHVLRVAPLPIPVLIRGESGTGKELVARAIQQASKRASGPFVSVNMAAIPPAIAASELFGHAAGAFTGAARGHAGYFAQASGGTLFLDEIGETPPDVQAMLLRVLESQETQPLGSASRARVDVRIIAATDADLETGARTGRFREALLYRLAGYQFALPPLRERRDDIGRLLLHRLQEELRSLGESERLSQLDGPEPWLDASLVGALARYDWPGNVRQLCNVARHLAISSGSGQPLDDLPRTLLEGMAGPRAAAAGREAPSASRRPASEISEEEVLSALRSAEWSTSEAARRLGISRTTLYKLVDRSPSLRKARDVSEEEIRRCHAECRGDVDAAAARLQVSPRGLRLRMRELGLE
jgi:two-component system nitrogen regulation response regulator GlnG